MEINLISALMAIPALWFAAVTGIMFFFERKELYGALNDIFSSVLMFLLVLPVLEFHQIYLGSNDALGFFSLIVAAGLTLAGVGQILLVLRLITLNKSFISGGLGILPFLVWIIVIAMKSLDDQSLDTGLGVISIAVIIGIVLLALSYSKMNKEIKLKTVSLIFLIGILTVWLMKLAELIS